MPGDMARQLAYGLGKRVGCERETSEELLECLQKVEDVNTFIENQQGEVCLIRCIV